MCARIPYDPPVGRKILARAPVLHPILKTIVNRLADIGVIPGPNAAGGFSSADPDTPPLGRIPTVSNIIAEAGSAMEYLGHMRSPCQFVEDVLEMVGR